MLKDHGVIGISLSELEKHFPKLSSVKKDRLKKEFYVNAKPFLLQYILEKYDEDVVALIDADMAFWGDPNEIFETMKDHSIMLVDHEFEPTHRAGRFNAGFVGVRNDNSGRKFLKWWGNKCIQWCRWISTSDGRCADQGYLTALYKDNNMFPGFLSCPHPGINLGPWNIRKHRVSKVDGNIMVDDKRLICYHYHEFKLVGNTYHPTGYALRNSDKTILYDSYFRLVQSRLGGFKNG
jgi:hypothetical protein